jgi:integral membrane protein
MKNLNLFKKIGIAEAISYLVLLGIAMPLKYMLDMPLMVKYVGWAHGILFMAYVIWLLLAAYEQKWGVGKIFLGFLASLIPFGPFIFHREKIEVA